MDQRKQKVEGYFDQIAADYARLYQGGESLAAYPGGPVRLAKAIGLLGQYKSAGTVLDIGCGTGHTALELARRGYEVVGIDISSQMVRQARALFNQQGADLAGRGRFEVGDVESLPLTDGSADAVVALGLIEYLTEDGKLAGEIHRMLKPGGVAVIAFRNRLFDLFSLNDYTQDELTQGALGSLLEEARAEFDAAWPAQATQLYVAQLAAQVQALQSRTQEPAPAPGLKPLPIQLRQHTPRSARAAFTQQGFVVRDLLYFHFHPFPPVLQRGDPEAYVRLGLAMEALDRSPVGAVMASAFLIAFQRT